MSGLASALVQSWKLYSQPKSVILFLIEDVTYNICDQKFHEFEIREQCPEAFVIRKTLTEIGTRGKLTEVTKQKSPSFIIFVDCIMLKCVGVGGGLLSNVVRTQMTWILSLVFLK